MLQKTKTNFIYECLTHFVRESQGNLPWVAHLDPTSTQKKTNLRAREYHLEKPPRIIFPAIPNGLFFQHLTSLKERNFKLDKK